MINLPALMKKYWDDNPGNWPWPPRENYYEHYMMWAGLVQPESYLEIGVMYGWSTMAVLLGWPHTRRVTLIDSELYEIPLTEAVRRIEGFCKDQGIILPIITTIKVDTTKQAEFCFPGQNFDLSHVDGSHGEEAVYHDLNLVEYYTNRAIIVDDLKLPGIKPGADRFLAEHPEWEAQVHRDHQDHYVMWRR